jgi:6-phosphofructokinase 1
MKNRQGFYLQQTMSANSQSEENDGPKIAFLTSGGDAPGMNPAIRAIVRMSIYLKCQPFAVIGGFQGLLDDCDETSTIIPFGWDDVAYIMADGGTIIRSSRSKEFRERSGRLKAARNLIRKGIDKLIVIGGDGSLTGADIFRTEWKGLLGELVVAGEIDDGQAKRYENFMVVGLVGSIDNDMYGTEMTIGADSSLHRIIEAVDNITSTATSHSRAFIIEVMGRHCGWLALNACLAIGADYLLIPEDPPKRGWEAKMVETMKRVHSVIPITSNVFDVFV